MVAGDDALLLPPEIHREILTRVSVKTILRCRSVCKSWHSFVSCPNFISEYSTRNLNKNGNQFLLRLEHHESYFGSYSSLDESSMESRKHHDIPKAFLGSCPQIIGSCNGLICFSGNRGTACTFLIWNPTIRKIVKLPHRTSCPLTESIAYCGFGFDSKTNDYKVLRVVRDVKNYDSSSSDVCEIFDLRKGVWRVICPRMPSSRRVRGRNFPDCYLDGAVHWSDCRVLLSFNLTGECFQEIKMPKYPKSFEGQLLFLDIRSVTFNELIYVIMWTGREDWSVWAMKEYGVAESWTKMFNIDLPRRQDFDPVPFSSSFIYLWKNGEVLMVRAHQVDVDGDLWNREDLVSYNPESEKYTTLFSTETRRISYFCLYEESLVLL